MVAYKDKKQSLHIKETMDSLLMPLKQHLNADTREVVEEAMRLLRAIPVEGEEDKEDISPDKGKNAETIHQLREMLDYHIGQGIAHKDDVMFDTNTNAKDIEALTYAIETLISL